MRPGKSAWLWLCTATYVAACGGRTGFEVGKIGGASTEDDNGGTSSQGGAGTPGAGTSFGGSSFGGSIAGTAGLGNVFTGARGGSAATGGAGGFSGFPGGSTGEAGFAGQAGAVPMVGAPCTVNGAVGCLRPAQSILLRCDGTS
jgi:hypothetical protein